MDLGLSGKKKKRKWLNQAGLKSGDEAAAARRALEGDLGHLQAGSERTDVLKLCLQATSSTNSPGSADQSMHLLDLCRFLEGSYVANHSIQLS